MRWILLCALAGALGMMASDVHSQQSAPVSKRAHDLHFRSIVLDTHDDTTQRLVYDQFDLDHLDPRGSIDIPRMRAGGLSGIFFSIYTPGTLTGAPAVKAALDQIDAVRQQVWKHPKELALCTTAAEVRAAHAQGKIAALMGSRAGT